MGDDQELVEVAFDRVFNAPRELVFRCMTTPEDLAQFWGPEGVHTPLENITVDLRVGGVFETIMVNDATGEEYASRGVCIELDAPKRFAMRESGNAEGMVTAIDFIDQGDGTTRCVTLQSNVPAMYATPEARAGMESAFRQFDKYLATLV